jgi:hypothetical protein
MGHLPSIQTLRAFEAAGRLRSYSRAAETLGLTHGAISHRIRELEDRLGVKLFRREANAMIPTPEASRLLIQVGHGLSLLEQAFGAPPAGAAPRRLVVTVLPCAGWGRGWPASGPGRRTSSSNCVRARRLSTSPAPGSMRRCATGRAAGPACSRKS